jgi:glycosyltransferase involved in cell wall biosynthesis
MLPRVSIVITNHNYARFLGDAIESALRQTHPDSEVVVVDDGSTDDSLAVIQRYPDVIPVVQPNLGQAAAFNAGLARASGDVLIFLDADDMLDSDTAQTVAATFGHEPRVVKVMYRLRIVDESGSPSGELKPPNHLPLRSGDLTRYVLHFPFDMTWMATSGNAFRKSALTRILPVPEQDYPICADYYLSHLTLLLGDVLFLDQVGGSYRVHGANSYERVEGQLDLEQVRQTIVSCRHTARHLVDLAERLELEGRPRAVDDVLSVSELSHRLVSLRLDPERHPVQGDTRLRLLLLGQRAALGRFDVERPLRLLLAGWVAAVALVPRVLLPRLLERRAHAADLGRVSALLGRFHRR